MTLLSLFGAQRSAFETAYQSGDWRPLGEFFADDLTYEVMNMPFHCVLRGREAVLAGFERSVERFDKLCIRTVGINSTVREEGANVLISAGICFERDGAPALNSRLWEIASYVDGKIQRLIDIYDAPDHDRFVQWMAAWGAGLDPRYA
jgi:ketosteroid isomerase-like protein